MNSIGFSASYYCKSRKEAGRLIKENLQKPGDEVGYYINEEEKPDNRYNVVTEEDLSSAKEKVDWNAIKNLYIISISNRGAEKVQYLGKIKNISDITLEK